MKTIQLLQSAAAISVAAAQGHGYDHGQNHQRNNHLRHLMRDNATSASPGPPPIITCASDETPCHTESDAVYACAPPGGKCPCLGNGVRCHNPGFGEYCDVVCCEWGKEERCHQPNEENPQWYDIFCAKVSEGGCPCADGETKCGVSMTGDGGITGHCTSLCCDGDGLQTCYDDDYNPSYCSHVDEGGCPCPEGKVKCGATDDWAGYCTDVCCTEGEDTCYNDGGKKSCSREGCDARTSMDYWRSRVASTILANGTGSQVAYYSSIVARKKKLLNSSSSSSPGSDFIKSLEAEEAALFHAIRLREGRRKFEKLMMLSSGAKQVSEKM